MRVSRRRFLGASSAAAASGAALLTSTPMAYAVPPAILSPRQGGPPTPPAIEMIALNRMGFGPRPGDLERVQALGFENYVQEQLSPIDSQDTLLNQRLASAKLRIEYGPWESRISEDLPFSYLDAPLETLWPLANYQIEPEGAKRNRPLDEVIAATWLRAVYSTWQLRELLVDFWHNHFNVYAYTNQAVTTTWPLYDKIMRRNCLGNFRDLLREVAKSIAMQYYLNNASNTSGAPNENYARELFELHTLGSLHYFNTLYGDWEKVPGASEGKPIGYVDDDVYEASRALTGWTIEDGSRHGGITLPNTGRFRFNEPAHDRFQKRVLATNFDNDQKAEDDGERVLKLVSEHPGTAKYLCLKLCRRLVADNPPEALVNRAVAVWTASLNAPDQIKQVVETILRSDEFRANWGQKIKRPFELYVSFLRATGMEFPPNGLFNTDLAYGFSEAAGQRLFYWRPPTGHPDHSTYWLSTAITLRRWNGLNRLTQRDFWRLASGSQAPIPVRALTPSDKVTTRQIVDFWITRLLGREVAAEVREELMRFLARNRGFDVAPTGDAADLEERLNLMVALIGMTPDFQWR